MLKNEEFEILANKNIEINEKLSILQKIENFCSKKQKRSEREIVPTNDSTFIQPGADAQYHFAYPRCIYINSKSNGLKTYISVVHEGVHAMCDDAFNGKVDKIYTYKKYDKEKLIYERKNKDIIFNYFIRNDCLINFNLNYYEEVLAHNEPIFYFLYDFYNNAILDLPNYQIPFQELESFLVEKEKHDYEQEIKNINFDNFREHVLKIEDFQMENYNDSQFISHVREQVKIFMNLKYKFGKNKENAEKNFIQNAFVYSKKFK